jgi:hypothetical protein
MSSFTHEPNAGLSLADYERKLLARDKTIDVLKRRIAQEARHSHTTPLRFWNRILVWRKSLLVRRWNSRTSGASLKKHYPNYG